MGGTGTAGTPDSWASSESVRRSMRSNRGRDTSPELAVRRLLHARGLRYRVDRRPVRTLRRRADIVFTRGRVAVFIDGCFWHGCPEHYTRPAANEQFWAQKVAANIARDTDTNARLISEGWTVIRVWEHEEPSSAAKRIESAVTDARRVSTMHPADKGASAAHLPPERSTGPLGETFGDQ